MDRFSNDTNPAKASSDMFKENSGFWTSSSDFFKDDLDHQEVDQDQVFVCVGQSSTAEAASEMEVSQCFTAGCLALNAANTKASTAYEKEIEKKTIEDDDEEMGGIFGVYAENQILMEFKKPQVKKEVKTLQDVFDEYTRDMVDFYTSVYLDILNFTF